MVSVQKIPIPGSLDRKCMEVKGMEEVEGKWDIAGRDIAGRGHIKKVHGIAGHIHGLCVQGLDARQPQSTLDHGS